MKKMLNLIKNNVPAIIISIIIGGIFQINANNNIPSIGVSYSNSKTAETTVNGALNDLFNAVDINEKIDEIQNKINDIETTTILEKSYPIGSIYISTSSTNPGSIMGGTWVAYGTGKTLVGIDANNANFSTVEKTGGSSSVKLTTSQLPSHTHSIPVLSGTAASNGAHTHSVSGTAASNGAHTHSVSATAASAGAHQHYLFKNSAPIGSGSYASGNSGEILDPYWKYHIYAHTSAPDLYLSSSNGAHTHSVSGTAASAGAHTHTTSGTAASAGAHTHSVSTTASTTGSNGSGTEINIQNPYITVYMWKRTA